MPDTAALTKQQQDKDDVKDDQEQKLFAPLSLPFKHSVVDGWIYPPFIKEETIEKTKSFELRESDVFVATYPKCGTTWTQNIITKLHEIHETGALKDMGSHLLEIIPWLENYDTEKLAARPSPRYLKTHNPYQHLAQNPEVGCRYLMISRNPKDACVSLYHHAKGFAVFEYTGDFEQFANLFLEGNVESGCWWTHLKEYYQNKNQLDTLFMRYEDLHTQGVHLIGKINDFLALPELSQQGCQKVQEMSSFKKQKTDPSANYSWRNEQRNKDQTPFMRKGTVGDWRNFFSKELSDKFNQKTKDMLGEFKVFDDYVTDIE